MRGYKTKPTISDPRFKVPGNQGRRCGYMFGSQQQGDRGETKLFACPRLRVGARYGHIHSTRHQQSGTWCSRGRVIGPRNGWQTAVQVRRSLRLHLSE
ncbi:hypothetical protein NDU88_003445 [Pleurodeles waltl]|uniref:Uncharacterized protein n=1 Tax=Pleurodeles waltl TaxID=8319 RepID=A0AAV7SDH9_PLEWA|nr:hypothetical protein NDU88_003445 [Pleurodeles waltl]